MNKCLRQNQNLWQQKLCIAEKALKEIKEAKERVIIVIFDLKKIITFMYLFNSDSCKIFASLQVFH